ncbi:MAG: inositol monophosphatase family protein [Gammaproteobacteria bacterium]|nr:inositol monophosphatase family protein [Gammaproteobacteria bacterium]MDE0440744.1 inositol monophosphatase family protein [Gammaproteobacteria bacterium]
MEPLVNIALRAARRAGRIILRSMDRIDTLTVREKGRNDLVSEIDVEAEDLIVDTILKAYPHHTILAEERGSSEPVDTSDEGSEAADQPPYTWIIDPLDGTTNFLHGIPHFCTSIAVTRGAALLHGVVVDHVRNEEFTASRGSGARLNGRRIRVAARDRIDDSIIAGGLPFASVADHIDAYGDILKEFMGRCRTLRRQGSAALDLAYLAAGRVDGFFELGLKPWDIAAAAVIIREAGGFIGDAGGGERFLDSGNVVAANPKIFRAMLRIIRANAVKHGDPLIDG